MMKKRNNRVLALLLSLVMTLALVMPASAAGAETHVTILLTSDMHGDIIGYDYTTTKETSDTGMARAYTYIQQVRAEEDNVILLDAGDDIQGTIMTDDIYNKDLTLEHPVIAAMNAMGYDAMTLGNHEFNWGIRAMQTITGRATFPVLCANVLDKDGKSVTGRGWTIVEKGGVKFGIIGVTSPYVPTWDGTKEGIADCTYESAPEAVTKAIREIGDQADIIIVSAHMPVEAEFGAEDGRDSGTRIVEDNPEVDILQVGHAHKDVNTEINGVPVVGVVNLCKKIGRIDLTLNASKEIIAKEATLVSLKDVEPSSTICDLPIVKEAQEKAVQLITGDVLGTSTAKFQPENEYKLPAGRLQDTAVMDLINKVQLENSGADVSAAALFSRTSDLPEGELKYSNIFSIYKYDNVLYRVRVTGAELRTYMEWAAECWNQWIPGDVTISFNPDKPDYLHDVFAGVDYEVDLSQPAGSRIKNVMFKGAPLKDDQELTLAVNDYRFSSTVSGMIANKTREWESAESIRTMLVDYLAKNSPISPEVDNNWKIVGVDLQKDSAERAEILKQINSGEREEPYSKSVNIAGRVAASAAVQTGSDGTLYYRLRDVATSLKGTKYAFNVDWTPTAGVTVNRGGEYADAPLGKPGAGTPSEGSLLVTVDGTPITVRAMNLNNNNYVSAEGVAALLGVSAVSFNTTLVVG